MQSKDNNPNDRFDSATKSTGRAIKQTYLIARVMFPRTSSIVIS